MAWRLADSVVRGEIDNRQRGRVTGRLWLLGRPDPIALDLAGHPQRDLAGCLLTFENPHPKPGDAVNLQAQQRGTVGDLTASRKVYVLDVSLEEAMRMGRSGQTAPRHQANAIYLEWFSQFNGRVVIESADFRVTVSEPSWRLSPQEEERQTAASRESFRDWLDRLDEGLDDEGPEREQETFDFEAERPMDEFAWERLFRESDRRTDKLQEIQTKYAGHPDAELLIAREMGWTWLEEGLEAQKRGVFEKEEKEAAHEEYPPLVPNPLTEGRDWIRDERGYVCHPLVRRCSDLGLSMWRHAKEHRLVADEGPSTAASEMASCVQICGAKLAGALNGLAYQERESEPGFVVAALKRALTFLHEAMEQAAKAGDADPALAAMVATFQPEMFAVREAVLQLMKEFREKPEN